MSRIQFYPKLNKNIIDSSKYKSSKIKLSYNDLIRNVELELKVKDNDKTIILLDEYNRWVYNINNLILKKSISLETKSIFGKDGIAPTNSTVGIYVNHDAYKSLNRGVKKIGVFNNQLQTVNFDIEYNFKENQILDKAVVGIYLYLETEDDNIDASELHLSNTKGSILGKFEDIELVYQGRKSMFPTREIEDRSKPLWELFINYELYDYLDETIELIINKSHKDYHLFDINNKEKYSFEYVREVMINVVVMLLVSSTEFNHELDNNEFELGTLGYLLSYYRKVFDIKSDRIEDIYSSVSKGVNP